MSKFNLGEMTIEDAAKLASGNWKPFDSFVWWKATELEDSENWFIYYGHHRESCLLDKSNSAQIADALKPFFGTDVEEEDHSHWAVGWIRGWSIRVFKNDQITDAFKVMHELLEKIATYPILNESHYSELETEATFQNIPWAASQLKSEFELPDDCVDRVYDWLSDNNWSALESSDDQGGYPDEDALRESFVALGFKQLDLVG